MNEKEKGFLTARQKEGIEETLCRLVLNDASPSRLAEAREALIKEFFAINLLPCRL